MKKIRLIIIAVMCLMGCITARAQDDFNPASPSEPGPPTIYSRIVLLRNISDAGSVSGEGRYAVGNTVNVYAYVNAGYTFQKWTDTRGNLLGTSTTLSFVNTEQTDTLIANYAFTPGSPSEPSEPSTTLYYRLGLNATAGCTVSGAGRYLAGTGVSVYASIESGYSFLGWTNRKGETVSMSTSFSYTMPVDGDTLTANCVFIPNSPAEPSDPVLRHNVTVATSDGGYYSGSTGRFLEGSTYSLYAYPNTGYDFVGWYLNGELYTTLRSFSYTVGNENMNFLAKFVFNPSSPGEPNMPAISEYSYYLMTVNGRPGDTVKYAINLVNTQVVKDMNIRITFPAGVVVEPGDYTLSDKATGYDVTICEAVDTISIIEEGAQLWDFTMIGGTTEPATQALLTFDIFLPDTIDTGHRHQVKINQISMTMEDGTAVTARTRNGVIGVFRNGDANGDDAVDALDASLILQYVAHKFGDDNSDFIKEAADTNNGSEVDALDASLVLQHAAKKIDLNEIETQE
ncbi:MAG: dockerin type I repeat-containing protein [Bacteroidales bacterium]|nr:dockerin type I repeat-containing protein [Bacteroidales bacterium]